MYLKSHYVIFTQLSSRSFNICIFKLFWPFSQSNRPKVFKIDLYLILDKNELRIPRPKRNFTLKRWLNEPGMVNIGTSNQNLDRKHWQLSFIVNFIMVQVYSQSLKYSLVGDTWNIDWILRTLSTFFERSITIYDDYSISQSQFINNK